MTNAWALSALWVGLALVATLLAILVRGFDGTLRDRRRHGCAAGYWRYARHERPAGKYPIDHFPCRCGTRSSDLQNQMARSTDCWLGWVLWAVPGLHCDSLLRPSLVDHVQLAGRRRTLDDLDSPRIRRDARTRLQRDRVRQGNDCPLRERLCNSSSNEQRLHNLRLSGRESGIIMSENTKLQALEILDSRGYPHSGRHGDSGESGHRDRESAFRRLYRQAKPGTQGRAFMTTGRSRQRHKRLQPVLESTVIAHLGR
jgi:hypothetical protein